MQTLPVFLTIRDKPCLLVGEGEVASRKRRVLERAGAVVHAVAADVREAQLDGMSLVVAASTDMTLNRQVSAWAQQRAIPVNVVDCPELCTFIFPSTVERGAVTVAVSSGGTLPVLTRLLRARIESWLPPSLADFVEQAGRWQPTVRQRLPDVSRRLRFWDSLLQQFLLSPDGQLADLARQADIEQHLQALDDEGLTGRIQVIGAGPGDPDLLTFKALRCLQGCDVVAWADGVPPAIVGLARRDARQLALMPGDAVVPLLQAEAAAGAAVAYLLPGDPLSWRDTALHLAHWQAAGIACDVVPGILGTPGGFPHDE